ncbi:MAG: pilus assembly protein TadG-related protein [Gammaproteobacteria bacterium]|nr:pilus assembly protein TadG-related protein [Gammaproteobacteria bacterium]
MFVVIFLGVMLFSLITLYNAGKLTSEKMQLQNAADAAAYSVSVIEARDLNFMSYINRAMVANEVAVGQMVSMVSWIRYLGSVPSYMRFYDKTFLAGPTLGISTSIIEPIAGVWQSVAKAVESGLRALASAATKILHVINKIYSVAQTGYHAMTVVFAVATMDEMIRNNSPPRFDAEGNKVAEGGKLSDFGYLSLIGHLLSYGAIPKLQLPSISFTRTYFPNAPADYSGFERFASITQAARDPFTRERGKTYSLNVFNATRTWSPAGNCRCWPSATAAQSTFSFSSCITTSSLRSTWRARAVPNCAMPASPRAARPTSAKTPRKKPARWGPASTGRPVIPSAWR